MACISFIYLCVSCFKFQSVVELYSEVVDPKSLLLWVLHLSHGSPWGSNLSFSWWSMFFLSDSNGIFTHNHLVLQRILNHLTSLTSFLFWYFLRKKRYHQLPSLSFISLNSLFDRCMCHCASGLSQNNFFTTTHWEYNFRKGLYFLCI